MATKKEQQDHRVRVAAEKRRKMKARLLDAVLQCCTADAEFTIPSAEQVCRQAEVSRATFYAHFDSVAAAVEELGEAQLEAMVQDLSTMFEDSSPVERITMGLNLFLMRGATDPAWARFVARVVQINPATDFAKNVRTDIQNASDAGEIDIANVDAAVSVALGSLFEGIRHLHLTGEVQRDYVEKLTAMVLQALGVEPETADRTVRQQSIRIRGMAPDFVDWWRDPWA